jgi:UDP-N-acetylmuramoylalanine--D-glutamate ligase
MAVPVLTMIDMFDTTRRTLVVGLGKTGLSVARFLSQRGVPVAIVDSREHPPALESLRSELPADVALFLGGFKAEAFERAERVIVSPGVTVKEPLILAAAARGVPVIGDVELFAQLITAPVVAITGSNGKSTVTTLLNAMAQSAGRDVRMGANIGTPALDLIAEREPDLYVLELSSFQLETTFSLRPAASVVLNISADHLDRYADLDAYSNAKRSIYRNAAIQVVNADDPLVVRLAYPDKSQIRYTMGVPAAGEYGRCDYQGASWLARGDEPIMPVSGIRMDGRHNVSNTLAALALGEAAGLPRDAMIEAINEFRGLPHRMQLVAHQAGIRWYNDSKGTNVGATLAAIDSAEGRVVLIAGGDAKGADLSPLAPAMREKGRGAVLIGRDASRLQEVLQSVIPLERAADMQEAVELAARMAQPGDSALLSPACASTDMYRDYQERGELFVKAVRGLVT